MPRHAFKPRPATLMLRIPGVYQGTRMDVEIQRCAHPNFYSWAEKTKQHYLNKRFPGWTHCGNGLPWHFHDAHDIVPYERFALAKKIKPTPTR